MPTSAIMSQDGADCQVGTLNIYLQMTAGTSGAAPSTFTTATGITGVTKSSNDYIVAFDSAYLKLVDFDIHVLQASYNASTGACSGNITAVSFDDSTPTVTMSFYNAAGTAVALATGDVLRATFKFTYLPQPNE